MSKKNEGKAKLGLLLALVVAFVAASVHAYTVKRSVDADGTQIFLLEDSGNLTVGGTVTSAGAQTITAGGLTITAGGLTVTAGGATITAGGLSVAGPVTIGSFSETIADLAVITNRGAVAILTGTSGGTTNTILNPTAAGETLTLINNAAFLIVIADSGNVKLAGAISLTEDDVLELVSTSASEWVEVSRSVN